MEESLRRQGSRQPCLMRLDPDIPIRKPSAVSFSVFGKKLVLLTQQFKR